MIFYEEYTDVTNAYVKAIKLDTNGNYLWPDEQITMCSVASSKVHSVASQFANNQIIASWEDDRNGQKDIYAQNINFDGSLGASTANGTIEGTVTLNGGSGNVEDVEITAEAITVNPDANGDYIITIVPGTYDVTAELDGYGLVTIEDIVVTEGNATTGVDFTLEPIVSSENIIVTNTMLGKNYPNPFNPITNITYSITQIGHVTIEVYNLKGQLIKTLVNEFKETGEYSINWNGTDKTNKPVSSGVYLYKMKSGNYTSSKKMILMK